MTVVNKILLFQILLYSLLVWNTHSLIQNILDKAWGQTSVSFATVVLIIAYLFRLVQEDFED